MIIRTITLLFLLTVNQVNVFAENSNEQSVELTDNQVKALKLLNKEQNKSITSQQAQVVRLEFTKLVDNQGQAYIGSIISRGELAPYLTQLSQLLGDNFEQYRAQQAARDHQVFHLTLLSPQEYQLADKTLVDKLLSTKPDSGIDNPFPRDVRANLLGLGKVEKDNKKTFYVVAQSDDAQLIRQRFLLPEKDFHVTLAFYPSDIYGVRKDINTLITH